MAENVRHGMALLPSSQPHLVVPVSVERENVPSLFFLLTNST